MIKAWAENHRKKRIKRLMTEIVDLRQTYYDIYRTQGVKDASIIWGIIQREDEIKKLERELKK